ncbi:GAF domain-containing sensor histidine kinase [Halorubellus sp. PRR65]|uniref:GAF domain-containing sensor histidine kinase n=1 Tax=Halorubellus sp. PRR65 TaxID=3098148 RepID=UPI002B25C9FD|nr:GAF domain-containing sensor histidine kinase [Halorubellus sp. PRR65]
MTDDHVPDDGPGSDATTSGLDVLQGTDDLDADRARRALYVVMQEDLSFERKAERALAIGRRYLDVDNGHVTRVDPETDYWKALASTDDADGQFPAGLLVELGETYCRRTVASDDPIALHEASAQGWGDDPAYDAHGLECYHGTTITLDDEPYGTVCFVSEDARSEPFSDDETLFAELVARLLEHELERERTAARIDRLEAFASVVSHDLRNPLTVASGSVATAREERESEHLAVAAESLDRMEALIDDVMQMARSGGDVDATDLVSLSTVADASWACVDTAGADLAVVDDAVFRADRDRVRSLFENLFRNAVEHGREDVSVDVGALDSDGFYVADDGPGIPERDREVVFETGYTTGGIGLGLAIVENVATAHGWTVAVDESDAGGARFEVTDVVLERT